MSRSIPDTIRRLPVAVLAPVVAVLALLAAPASALGDPPAPFQTLTVDAGELQQAVDAVGEFSTIYVRPGVYEGPLSIGHGRDGLRIIGRKGGKKTPGPSQVIIDAGDHQTGIEVRARGVMLQNLVVTGSVAFGINAEQPDVTTNPQLPGLKVLGVLVDGRSVMYEAGIRSEQNRTRIEKSLVTNVNGSGVSLTESAVGSAVKSNKVLFPSGAGIVSRGKDSLVERNTLVAHGAFDSVGIEAAGGYARVQRNTVLGQWDTGISIQGYEYLVSRNRIDGPARGIWIHSASGGSRVERNKIINVLDNGIMTDVHHPVIDSSGVPPLIIDRNELAAVGGHGIQARVSHMVVRRNKLTDVGQRGGDAIAMQTFQGAVLDNRINRAGGSGVNAEDNGTDILRNRISNVSRRGIFLGGSATGSVISQNRVDGAREAGLYNAALGNSITGNTFKRNVLDVHLNKPAEFIGNAYDSMVEDF